MATNTTPSVIADQTSQAGPRENRFTRFSGLLDPETIQSTCAVIAGVGAIGRSLALQMAQLGVGYLGLCDPQTVEEVNLGTQGYCPDQIGGYKANATMLDARRLNPECEIFTCTSPLPNSRIWEDEFYLTAKHRVLFLTTDNMTSRRGILEELKTIRPLNRPRLVVDVRMLGEVFQIRCLQLDPRLGVSPLQEYLDTQIFDDSQSISGNCTTRMTGYAAACSASLAVLLATKHLRQIEVPRRLDVDLFTLTMDIR